MELAVKWRPPNPGVGLMMATSTLSAQPAADAQSPVVGDVCNLRLD